MKSLQLVGKASTMPQRHPPNPAKIRNLHMPKNQRIQASRRLHDIPQNHRISIRQVQKLLYRLQHIGRQLLLLSRRQHGTGKRFRQEFSAPASQFQPRTCSDNRQDPDHNLWVERGISKHEVPGCVELGDLAANWIRGLSHGRWSVEFVGYAKDDKHTIECSLRGLVESNSG